MLDQKKNHYTKQINYITLTTKVFEEFVCLYIGNFVDICNSHVYTVHHCYRSKIQKFKGRIFR